MRTVPEILEQLNKTLTIPAAEYVPAIGDAFLLIDEALAAHRAQATVKDSLPVAPLADIERINSRRWRFAFIESDNWTYAVCKWDGDDWIPINTAADVHELDDAMAASHVPVQHPQADKQGEAVVRARVTSVTPGRIDEFDVLRPLPIGEHLLYASPHQVAQPLTEQEIWDAVQHGVVGSIGMPSKAIAVARAIEAAHGIAAPTKEPTNG